MASGPAGVMKAAVYGHPGGPEVFRYQEVPDPELVAGSVLVRVEAVSVEGGDTRPPGEKPAALIRPLRYIGAA